MALSESALSELLVALADRDRGVKFEDFQAHNVAEYWIVDADEQVVEQYVRRGQRLELAMKSGTGELRSVAVRGFVVPVRAFFDEQENLRVLQEFLKGT